MKDGRVRGIVAGVVMLTVLLGATVAQADSVFVSIRGTKQGQFRGEAPQVNVKDKLVGVAFRYELTSPRDAATGMATGKRVHKPVVITKEWGAASPQLFQALVTNEVLQEVVIDFVGVNANGESYLTHRIRLTNATVVNIAHFSEGIGPGTTGAKHASGSSGLRHLEEVSFVFQRIDLEDMNGKTTAVDEWRPVQ